MLKSTELLIECTLLKCLDIIYVVSHIIDIYMDAEVTLRWRDLKEPIEIFKYK